MTSSPPPNVILRGGPEQFAPPSHTRYVDDTATKLKLFVGNAWEHYEPTEEFMEHDGRNLRVFEWSRRTYVAE
jgi:hypothetical protein